MDRIDLPLEAVKIDGQYIEDAIEGYKTIITSGREGLTAEVATYTAGVSNGDNVKYSRFPAREIKVDFALKAASMEELRQKQNQLNNLLTAEDADFVFNDEPDKFFIGRIIVEENFSAYKNAVTGTYKIRCADPFKYSIEPITKKSTDAEGVELIGSSAVFTFDYNGSYPARPILRAEFASAKADGESNEDGDCGYVAFIDSDENIIQLGNPDALDLDEYSKSTTLINKNFSSLADWNMTSYANKTVTGTISASTIRDTYWDDGKALTSEFAKPSYGTGTGWHGSQLWKTTTGAVNFNLSIVHRLACSESNQLGLFECGAYNQDLLIAGFRIEKFGSGTLGKVEYIINGAQVGSNNIDLSYYNPHFGYCKRTAVYKRKYYNRKSKKWQNKKIKGARTKKVSNGYKYTQSNLNSSIRKNGEEITFNVGNLTQRTFTAPEVESTAAQTVSVYFGANAAKPAVHTNALHSVKFINNGNTPLAEIPNVFTAGDIVEADCNTASIYLMREGTIIGEYAPNYGALGNNWENFTIDKGTNAISVNWSDWVNPSYKPTITIEYNEVFI